MKGRITLVLAVGLAVILLASGCSRKEEGSVRDSSQGMKPASAHGSGSVASAGAGGELKFTAPADWISEAPASSMRKAQYRLPREDGDPEDGELAVFFFRGGGGGVQANIDRWIGQFSKADGSPASDVAKVTKRQSHGIALTLVEVNGTYMSAMGPMLAETKAKPNFRMLAAVAEAGAGPWFFKLTGPSKTVDKWEKSFNSFLDTIRE